MSFKEIAKDFSIVVIFVLVFGITFLFSKNFLSSSVKENLPASVAQPIIQSITPEMVVAKDEETTPQINTKSAISIEFRRNGNEKVLFEKDSDKEFPIASLAKLMTALVVMKRYDLKQEVVVSKTAMEQEGEQGDLKEGQFLSVENLLYIMLIESSNRAAYALSEVLGNDWFSSLMNEEAKELGMLNTHFQDSSGLGSNTYSTTRDLAKLSKYLFLNYPLFLKIVSNKEFNLYLPNGTFHHKLVNTNELLGQDDVIAGKTGYTYGAQGCYMVIQQVGQDKYVVNIILGANDRLLEMQRLLKMSSLMRNKTLIGG